MNAFQIVMLLLAVAFGVATLTAIGRARITYREAFVRMTLCVAFALAMARPDLTVVVAQALGVKRGADLVLYCSVVAMMLGFFATYARLTRLRREITLLVRQLAIRDAEHGPSAVGSSTPVKPPASEHSA